MTIEKINMSKVQKSMEKKSEELMTKNCYAKFDFVTLYMPYFLKRLKTNFWSLIHFLSIFSNIKKQLFLKIKNSSNKIRRKL
jgi:hypothetical protein